MTGTMDTAPPRLNRRLVLLAPLGVALAGGGAFWAMLSRMQHGTFDPHDIGNPMLNKPMPNFALPGFSSGDVRRAAQSKPVMINFFASWCIPCAAESDSIAAAQAAGIPIWGIAYKDKPDRIAAFLNQYGNPYAKQAADDSGQTFINFGAYGVPESYLIDSNGIIRWHLAGPLDDGSLQNSLLPAFKAAA